MGRPQIQVLFDDAVLTPPVSRALQLIGAESQLSTLREGSGAAESRFFDARLVVTSDLTRLTNGKLNTLLRTIDRNPCATLVLSDSSALIGTDTRSAMEERGVSVVTGATSDEIATRLSTLCTMRRQMSSLRGELHKLKTRDQSLNHDLKRLKSDLQTASELQRNLMRGPNAAVRGIDLQTVYIPADSVSGDSYRVVRLDKDHVSICLCDATGHGLAAAMMTEFVQRTIAGVEQRHGIELFDRPSIVLNTVNEEILRANLDDCQFAAITYAVFNETTATIRWSRGGSPHPFLIDNRDSTSEISGDGSVVGVIPNARFEVREVTLDEGEAFVLHSDGVELAHAATNQTPGLTRTTQGWIPSTETAKITPILAKLHRSGYTLRPQPGAADDVTIVSLSR